MQLLHNPLGNNQLNNVKNDEERKFILLQNIHSDVKGNQNFSLHNETRIFGLTIILQQ